MQGFNRRAAGKRWFAASRPNRLAEIDGTETKQVVFTFRNGATREFTGLSLLLTFSVPQFFFDVTTAYDILRHCGVDLARKDFLGTPGQFPED